MSRATAENTVAERRLRPIYDWLDNGNNKKALQEADKVLKKQQDFQCCRVLKCLALIRLGREEEAGPILDKVLSESPVDEGSLQAMTIAYRELHQPEKICTMYENATKKDPNNEELLSHLFMSYVRMGQYKKQKVAAMNLYKARPKNPYYFWSVMSVVLEALEGGDEKLSQNVLLPLAQTMVEKIEKEGRMEQEQETLLYLMILELRNDWQGGINVINGPLGKKLEQAATYITLCRNKRLDFQQKVGNWEEVSRLARNELLEQPDQWAVYQSYITAVLLLQSTNCPDQQEGEYHLEPDRIDRTAREAQQLVGQLQSRHSELRGPFLGELELISRLWASRQLASLPTNPPSVKELISKYFAKFGSKPICFDDLKLYLNSLDPEEVTELLQSLRDTIGDNHPESIKDVYRDICVEGMNRFCGKHLNKDVEELESVVRRLISRFRGTQKLVEHMEKTEVRPTDGYIVMAVHVLWDLWHKTRRDKYFYIATVFLHHAATLSPANAQIKFLLIRFYGVVGAAEPSNNIHATLDLKHLMLDTLGHLIPAQLMGTGHFSKAAAFYSASLKVYTSVYKDTADHIIQAYRCGSFYQIREIYGLRCRITQSQNYTSIGVDRMLLDLLVETTLHGQAVQMMSYLEIDPDRDETQWNNLTDNRDFKTMSSWEPPDYQVSDDTLAENFLLEQKGVKLRQLMLRCLATAVYLSEDIFPSREAENSGLCSNGNSGSGSHLAASMARLTAQLENHWADCKQACEDWTCPPNTPQQPVTPRVIAYNRTKQIDIVIDLLRLVTVIHNVSSGNIEKDADKAMKVISVHLQATLDIIEADITSGKSDSNSELIHRFRHLESIVQTAETCSLAAILCGVVQAITRPQGMSANKKKGKKKTSREVQPWFSGLVGNYNEMLKSLENAFNKLIQLLQDFETQVSLDEVVLLQNRFSDLNIIAEEEGGCGLELEVGQLEIGKAMAESYRSSVLQIKTILQNKLNYMSFLKL